MQMVGEIKKEFVTDYFKPYILRQAFSSTEKTNDNISVTYPNTDEVCKVFLEGLNNYPLIEDAFVHPVQPLHPKLSYIENWKFLDLYDNRDIYLRYIKFFSNKRTTYEQRYMDLGLADAKGWLMEEGATDERKYIMRRSDQMFTAKIDVDNDGIFEDVIRVNIDMRTSVFKPYFGNTQIIAFKQSEDKSFVYIDMPLSIAFNAISSFTITDLFFYNSKTYVKELKYDYANGWDLLYIKIKKFNDKQEIESLCLITSKIKENR